MRPYFSGRAAAACLAVMITAFAASGAQAHTAYMLPNVFAANLERYVTVESAFAESFFQPEVAVDSEDFHVILPDGSRGELDAVSRHRQVTVLERAMNEEGTYRFTSGVRRGRIGRLALVGDSWEPVRDKVPEGASEVRTSQTETVSDVYVSKKAPTRAPLDVRIGRLELRPVTHPSDAYTGEPFRFQVLFDGKPLTGQAIALDRGGARYDAVKFHESATSDDDGMVSVSFDKPGVYVVMTRHRADAPQGAQTEIRSYTTTLTFEVQP